MLNSYTESFQFYHESSLFLVQVLNYEQHHNNTNDTHTVYSHQSFYSIYLCFVFVFFFNFKMREYVYSNSTHAIFMCLCFYMFVCYVVMLSDSVVTFNFSLNEFFCDGIWFPCEPNAHNRHTNTYSQVTWNKFNAWVQNLNHFVSCRDQIANDSFILFFLFYLPYLTSTIAGLCGEIWSVVN